MWGATHTSAANYLAMSAGEFLATSVKGCNYLACADVGTSIYQQLDAVGRAWKAHSLPPSRAPWAAPTGGRQAAPGG